MSTALDRLKATEVQINTGIPTISVYSFRQISCQPEWNPFFIGSVLIEDSDWYPLVILKDSICDLITQLRSINLGTGYAQI